MKKQYFLIAFVLFLPLTTSVFGEDVFEFVVDGYKIITYNHLVTEITLNWDDPHLSRGTVTLSEPYTGSIMIKVPKEMPRTVNADFGTGWGLVYPNGEINQDIKEIDSKCHYILSMKLDDTDFVEFSTISVATGNWEVVSIQDHECGQDKDRLNSSIILRTDSLKQQIKEGLKFNEIICPNDNHVLAERPNGKLACVYETTATKLQWSIQNKN